ncbi:hypothetical protein OG884_26600 [Streptosporangium sp. NBC_01755]|uniref:hypothetical protein n=1 Tax=Streptosporangium sp. NBC_01755 TaxID=2975949 RepID=UPI002DD83071|nr:hypothetical protein [Streptosporangium sp. NBC_01755]WSC98420.1 hypothetical protein OG884_26600 [Streptosporangium sp. NBC_01755]
MKNEVVEDLEWCIEYWPDLIEARLPGTARPWRQPQLSPEAKLKRDWDARIDWALRTTHALGESPAPVDVAILSTALDLLVRADDLAADLGPVVMCPILAPPGPGELDARPYLRYAAARFAEGPEWLADGAEPTVRHIQQKIAQALCMVYDGQTLAVTCPWCSETGVWRVQTLPGGQVAIVCGGVCEPPQRDVGTWWGGQPVWPIAQWPWLAQRVMSAEEKVRRAREAIAS